MQRFYVPVALESMYCTNEAREVWELPKRFVSPTLEDVWSSLLQHREMMTVAKNEVDAINNNLFVIHFC